MVPGALRNIEATHNIRFVNSILTTTVGSALDAVVSSKGTQVVLMVRNTEQSC